MVCLGNVIFSRVQTPVFFFFFFNAFCVTVRIPKLSTFAVVGLCLKLRSQKVYSLIFLINEPLLIHSMYSILLLILRLESDIVIYALIAMFCSNYFS
jgi:hypothetical protein